MHSLSEDPICAALAAGCGFLYSHQPQAPPQSTSLFIYCQPYLTSDAARVSIAGRCKIERGFTQSTTPQKDGTTASPFPVSVTSLARKAMQKEAATLALESSPLDPFFANAPQVVTLVASTERPAEQVQLRYQQLARDELIPTSAEKTAEIQATLSTLDKLRAAVADLESKTSTSIKTLVNEMPDEHKNKSAGTTEGGA